MLEDSLMRILVDGLVLVNWLYCLCLRRMDEFFEVGNLLYLLYWRFCLNSHSSCKDVWPSIRIAYVYGRQDMFVGPVHWRRQRGAQPLPNVRAKNFFC